MGPLTLDGSSCTSCGGWYSSRHDSLRASGNQRREGQPHGSRSKSNKVPGSSLVSIDLKQPWVDWDSIPSIDLKQPWVDWDSIPKEQY
jgi:hypothetical protein